MFDEEEEDTTMTAVRYPCMPSLLSLQLMRNRLHLAFIGRKLMKWSSLATGRELRKLAMSLDLVYRAFAEEMQNAFMFLARGRYFCPIMNRMVLENPEEEASVTMKTATKTVSGCKVPQYVVIESGVEPYEHLGIEKGGQQIHEAKVAWLELIKRLVLIVELRNSFTLIRIANLNSTKRYKMISKILVPRTKITIHYIILEMEEMAREEINRMKMIKRFKLRQQKEKEPVCHICKMRIDLTKKKKRDVKSILSRGVSAMSTKLKTKSADTVKPTPSAKSVEFALHKSSATDLRKNASTNVESREICCSDIPQKHEIKELEKEPSLGKKYSKKEETTSLQKIGDDEKLQYLKRILAEIITSGKDMVQTGLNNMDINNFLKQCEEAKTRIDGYLSTGTEINSTLKNRLNQLKSYLTTIIGLIPELKDNMKLDDNLERTICRKSDDDVISVKMQPEITTIEDKKNLVCHGHSQDDIGLDERKKGSNIIPVTKPISLSQGENKDNFKTPSKVRFSYDKLKSLKSQFEELEKLSIDDKEVNSSRDGKLEKIRKVEKEDQASICKQMICSGNSIDRLTQCCKDFKERLEAYKNKVMSQPILPGGGRKLIKQKLNTKSDGPVAKEECPISENINDYIECCQNIKKLFERNKKKKENSQNADRICSNIDNTVTLLNELKEENMIDDSLLEILKRYETNEGVHKNSSWNDNTKSCELELSDSYCSCASKRNSVRDVCTECNTKDESLDSLLTVPPPCETCKNEEIMSCNKSCLGPGVCHSTCSMQKSTEDVEEKSTGHLCSNDCTGPSVSQSEEIAQHTFLTNEPSEKSELQSYDSSLGLFEKRIKKIIRVTRTLNEDGSIREETETIIIKKSRHDPTVTTLTDDDENIDENASFDDLDEDHDDCCNSNVLQACVINNQFGFMRKAKSELTTKVARTLEPILRRCVSIQHGLAKRWKKNMLSKILLPKIDATMSYIVTELEEQAREETFRLKLVKQQKARRQQGQQKIVCICNIPEEEDEEENTKMICPVCSLQNLSEETLVRPPCQKPDDDEDKKRLEYLLTHVDEIVKTLAEQKRGSKSTEKFIETCNTFKGSIKNFTNTMPLKTKSSTPSMFSLKRDTAKFAGDSDHCCCGMNNQGRDMKPMDTLRETVSEFHNRCTAPDDQEQRKCVSASQSRTGRNKGNKEGLCPVCSNKNEKKSRSASKSKICPKTCPSGQNESGETPCLVCSSRKEVCPQAYKPKKPEPPPKPKPCPKTCPSSNNESGENTETPCLVCSRRTEICPVKEKPPPKPKKPKPCPKTCPSGTKSSSSKSPPCLLCSIGDKTCPDESETDTPSVSEYHKRCVPEEPKQKKRDLCVSCQKKVEKKDKSKKPCSVCSSREKNIIGGRRSGSTEAIWRDAFTSTTGLEQIPSKMPSKSAMKKSGTSRSAQSNLAIKIISKPSSSRNRSGGESLDVASASSECLTCNYSSRTKSSYASDTNSSLCKQCRSKSVSKSKRGMSESNICSTCQAHNKQNKTDRKASSNKCPLCEKEKAAKKHSCPMCRGNESNESSLSEFQGGVCLSSEKSKCFVCGKERKDNVETGAEKSGLTCSILSFLKSKLCGEEKDVPCPCCGVSKAEEKCKFACILCKKSESKASKSSEELNTSGSCSLSNKSRGIGTDICKSCASSANTNTTSSSDDEICCGTQTSKPPTPKHSCKFDDNVKVARIPDSMRCVGEAMKSSPSKSSGNTRDIGVNTKAADRYDVRPVHMLANATSHISCVCKPQNPAKVCCCKSEPICSKKTKSTRQVRSFNL